MYSSAYVWAKVLSYIEERLGAVTISAWLDDAEVVELNENNKPVITFSAAEQGMNYCIYTISGAERTMIASISGDGTLRYTDEAAQGGMASYAVAAEHPRLTVLGKKAQGPLSRTVSVIVPYSAAEQTNVPEVTLEDTEFGDDFDWENAN